MALSYLCVTVSNPSAPQKKELVLFMVESGVVYSVVPCKTLAHLGIKPEEEREFTLANGQTIKRSLGIAHFGYDKHRGGAPIA